MRLAEEIIFGNTYNYFINEKENPLYRQRRNTDIRTGRRAD